MLQKVQNGPIRLFLPMITLFNSESFPSRMGIKRNFLVAQIHVCSAEGFAKLEVFWKWIHHFLYFPQGKERPKRKGPLDHLPVSTEEWASYDAPEEVVEAAPHPLMKAAAVSQTTITKPVRSHP